MKILFIFPNSYLSNGIPAGIATLSAVLKQAGHTVDIFDWTFVKTKHSSDTDSKTGNKGLFKPTAYTLEDLVADDPVQSLEDAFKAKLNEFGPDIVALSVMTGFFDDATSLLKKVRPSCLVVAGGVHPTICQEDALASDAIDCICVGDGEEFLLELCDRLEKGQDYTDLQNLGYRKNGQIKINPLRDFVDFNSLPTPDWDLFDERHLFRPFEGEIFKGSFYVMSRGCPEKCSYCVNSILKKKLKGCGTYFRYQTPETTVRHLAALKKQYGATWFKFADDSITLLSKRYLEELAGLLEPLQIKFGCSVRPETITEHKVDLLRRMGCVAASVGIESGNMQLRKEVLNRHMEDEHIEKAITLLREADIRVSTFNMIGLPGETRENVFETIRLNKKMGVSGVNVYIIYPYPGTTLSKKYKANFRDQNGQLIPVADAGRFGFSKMSRHELEGLLKTFEFYVKYPESMWPEIKKAEGADAQAQQVRADLEKRLQVLQNKKLSQ